MMIRTRFILLSSFIAVLSLVSGVFVQAEASSENGKPDGDFGELLEEYAQDINVQLSKSLNEGQWVAINHAWLNKMQEKLLTNPGSSKNRNGVLVAALALANTLDKNSLAEDLALELSDAVQSQRGPYIWTMRVRAEIAMKRYHLNEDDTGLIRAKEYLLETIRESESIWWLELQGFGYLQERLICTDLLGQCLTKMNEHPQAAAVYGRGAREASAILTILGGSSNSSLVHNVEFFAQHEAYAWARSGMIAQIIESIDRIVAEPELRLAPSVYVDRAARIFYGVGGSYSELVKMWIESHERDGWTAALEVLLANELIQEGNSEEATALLWRLYAEQSDNLESIDKANKSKLPHQNAGFYPTMLMQLHTVLQTNGSAEDAKVVLEKLQQEFPNSSLGR